MEIQEHDAPCCVICYYETNNCIAPCEHSFCEKCIERWYRKSGKNTCPLCTKNIASFNASQDLISNADFTLYAKKGEHLGVRLQSLPLNFGVKITSLNHNDIAYKSGIKKGMIITSINNIPITDHICAVKICEASRNTYGFVTIKIRKPTSNYKRKHFRTMCQECMHILRSIRI
jgi:hypothetical protein